MIQSKLKKNRADSRRRLGIQTLESRQLLAAHISELLVDPLFGDNNTTQMIELRGEPNTALDQGTYLVIAESGINVGEVHGIFDLSGQSFGSNGYLVLLQQDSPHIVEAGANVLRSTEEAFGGLPGDIYSDSHPISERIDFIIGANAYMLIQTDIEPLLEMDIDSDDNGLIDPLVTFAWTVLDSISLHPFVGRGDVAYGNIVFAEIGTGPIPITTAEGVPIVRTEGFGYAGRVGESVGSDPNDWVMGTIQDENQTIPDTDPQWALVDNLFGTPSQYPFSGRDLNHVGGPNFVGGVKGNVFDTVADAPMVEGKVFADTNGNNTHDLLTFVVDADDIVDPNNPPTSIPGRPDYPVLNAYPGVTISNFALESFAAHTVSSEQQYNFPNKLENRIFAKGGIDWFTKNEALRFDFYQPVRQASIVAIGDDNSLSEVYGRLEAYNALGELIATDVSGLLVNNARETISVSSPVDDIAYLFAFADQEVNGDEGDPWTRFDQLVYSQSEPYAITDENGDYELKHMFPGTYDLHVEGGNFAGEGRTIEINRYENFQQDFIRGLNSAPVITAASFSIAESAAGGTSVGTPSAYDPNDDPITFALGSVGSEKFEINSVTGQITTKQNAEFDFEERSEYNLEVIARDSEGAEDSGIFLIRVTDNNESPQLAERTFAVSESADIGTVIGTLEASDPDSDQTITYAVIGGNGQDFFSVSASTGVIELVSEVDHEQSNDLTIQVQVTDNGDPSLSTAATIRFEIVNENDAPVIESTHFSVAETLAVDSEVGTVKSSDQDTDQTLSYAIVGGAGNESFAIHQATGKITLTEPLDFDEADEFILEVRVSDNGEPVKSSTAAITISIGNENARPVIENATWEINENAESGSLIGSVLASDSDGDQTLSYAIVGGTGQGLFSINEETGTIRLAGDVDFESAASLTLEVEVTDTGAPALAATATISITVNDLNESPDVTPATWTIGELAAAGTEVGTVIAADPDHEQTLTYAITGGTGSSLFVINESTGAVTVSADADLDHESEDSVSLLISVTDTGTPSESTTAEFTVQISDDDEAPQFESEVAETGGMTGSEFSLSLPENLIVDPDGETHWNVGASLVDGDLPSWLRFDPALMLFTGIPTSILVGPIEIQLRVTDTDDDNLFSSLVFTINISISEKPLHNDVVAHDVNGDNRISASDALRIINYLAIQVPGTRIDSSIRIGAFLDVSGDNLVSALDALQVINQMSRESDGGDAEFANLAIKHSVTSNGIGDDDRDEAMLIYLTETGLF